ncbi:MAG: CPXCG motif-containing cysteine-rich protein [Myxococcaceae bacterium]
MDRRARTLLEEGIEQFNSQQFFEAHETWEQAWLTLKGPEKQLLQGLIQASAACVKWQRSEPEGAHRLATKAIASLYGVDEEEPSAVGVELPAFVDQLVLLREQSAGQVAASRTAAPSGGWPKLGYTPPSEGAAPVGGFSVFPTVRCPYCGEEVEVAVEAVGASSESFVQDCSVCCRPWAVHVSRDGGEVDVTLARDDD